MSEAASDGFGDEREERTALLAARFDHGQQRFHEAASASALRAEAQLAPDHGVAEHGASVHFVSPELDAGEVIAQAAVPVSAADTPDSLAARVLRVEHPLLVAVLQMAAAGRIAERDGRATLDGQPLFTPVRLEFAPM